MEDEDRDRAVEKGTGQGAAISPLLARHLPALRASTCGAERWRRREATGGMIIVDMPTTLLSVSSARLMPSASSHMMRERLQSS